MLLIGITLGAGVTPDLIAGCGLLAARASPASRVSVVLCQVAVQAFLTRRCRLGQEDVASSPPFPARSPMSSLLAESAARRRPPGGGRAEHPALPPRRDPAEPHRGGRIAADGSRGQAARRPAGAHPAPRRRRHREPRLPRAPRARRDALRQPARERRPARHRLGRRQPAQPGDRRQLRRRSAHRSAPASPTPTSRYLKRVGLASAGAFVVRDAGRRLMRAARRRIAGRAAAAGARRLRAGRARRHDGARARAPHGHRPMSPCINWRASSASR